MISSMNIFSVLHGYKQKNKEEQYQIMQGLIENGDIEILKFLLNPVYNYEITTSDGKNSILHSACHSGILEIVKLIVNNKLVDINHRDYLGRTGLLIAILFHNHKTVEFLLSKGADPNIPTYSGKSAIQYAIERNDDISLEFIEKYNSLLNKPL